MEDHIYKRKGSICYKQKWSNLLALGQMRGDGMSSFECCTDSLRSEVEES